MSASTGKGLKDVFSFQISPRATSHSVPDITLCPGQHHTVSRATSHCVPGNITLCPGQHHTVSRATSHCVQGNITLCPGQHHTVSRATSHCVPGNITLCPGQHLARVLRIELAWFTFTIQQNLLYHVESET